MDGIQQRHGIMQIKMAIRKNTKTIKNVRNFCFLYDLTSRKASNMHKKNKSPVHDQINAGMILAGGDDTVNIDYSLIMKIWKSEQWLLDW